MELDKIDINGTMYYVDSKLWELRAVNNPHDMRAMTCKTCAERELCMGAGDPYNIDGQCLIEPAVITMAVDGEN